MAFLIVSYSLLSRRNELRLGVSLVTGSKLGSPKRVIGKVVSQESILSTDFFSKTFLLAKIKKASEILDWIHKF